MLYWLFAISPAVNRTPYQTKMATDPAPIDWPIFLGKYIITKSGQEIISGDL